MPTFTFEDSAQFTPSMVAVAYANCQILRFFTVVGAIGFSVSLKAQETPIWSDIDCARSKIVAPVGLRCRTTQDYAGADSLISGAGGQGVFHRWVSFGILNGSKFYFYVIEGIAPHSYIQAGTVKDAVRNLSPYAKDAGIFSEPVALNGGDYSIFTNGAGEKCVGIRKVGPNHMAGYKWVMTVNKCVRNGAGLSTAEIGQFIAAAGFKE